MLVADPRDRRRAPAHEPDDVAQIEAQLGHGQRECRLEPQHARRGVVERLLHQLLGVRGMVGGDGVDRAVGQPHSDRVDVGGGPQGRVHLEHRVIGRAARVGEREVVRRRLGGDGHAPCPGGAHHRQRRGGRQVLEVDAAIREPGQCDVAQHHQFLRLGGDTRNAEAARPFAFVHVPAHGQGFVLAVPGEHDTESRCVFERPPHEPVVLDTPAVVGEQAHAECGHLANGRELLAGTVDGDGAGHPHVGETGLATEQHDLTDHCCVVDGRLGVRHGDNGREPAEGGSPRAGLDRLGLLAAGLAQVGVEVDQAGSHHAAPGVEHLVAVAGGEVGPDGGDASAADRDVAAPNAAGIDDAAALDHEARHRNSLPEPSSRNSTAMRTATPLRTWSTIMLRGRSATSAAISTPRFMGPGCITRAWSASRPHRRAVSP